MSKLNDKERDESARQGALDVYSVVKTDAKAEGKLGFNVIKLVAVFSSFVYYDTQLSYNIT